VPSTTEDKTTISAALLRDIKAHLDYKYPNVFNTENSDNRYPATDDRVSTACQDYASARFLPFYICNGLQEVLAGKTGNAFNEGYVDNLGTAFQAWLKNRVNNEPAHHNDFPNLPPRYQVVFETHYKMDLHAHQGAVGTPAVIKAVQTQLLADLGAHQFAIESSRVHVLSVLIDSDFNGAIISVAILPDMDPAKPDDTAQKASQMEEYFDSLITATAPPSSASASATEGDGDELVDSSPADGENPVEGELPLNADTVKSLTNQVSNGHKEGVLAVNTVPYTGAPAEPTPTTQSSTPSGASMPNVSVFLYFSLLLSSLLFIS